MTALAVAVSTKPRVAAPEWVPKKASTPEHSSFVRLLAIETFQTLIDSHYGKPIVNVKKLALEGKYIQIHACVANILGIRKISVSPIGTGADDARHSLVLNGPLHRATKDVFLKDMEIRKAVEALSLEDCSDCLPKPSVSDAELLHDLDRVEWEPERTVRDVLYEIDQIV